MELLIMEFSTIICHFTPSAHKYVVNKILIRYHISQICEYLSHSKRILTKYDYDNKIKQNFLLQGGQREGEYSGSRRR